MFVSTTRVQLERPTTAAERVQLEAVYDDLAKMPGFRAFYLARPSATEAASIVVFESEVDFKNATAQATPAIQAILGPLIIGTPQGESGEVNAQYVNPYTTPGFLSIRRARIKDPRSPAERAAIGKAYADAVAKVPEGRHAFYEVWPSDTELAHLGIYDSLDSRTTFMERLRSIPRDQPSPNLGEIVPPVQETVGDIVVYRVK
jgi:hypothetical protein